MLDSMTSQLASFDHSTTTEAATNMLYDDPDKSLEFCTNAFSYVFNFISKQEKGSGPNWKPTMTGLILTAAPPGKGSSMWVSEEGMEEFLLHGKDAVKEISLSPDLPGKGRITNA
jgi:hypothetical protein